MEDYNDIKDKSTMSLIPIIGERIPVNRKTWIDTHLMMSIIISTRSDDAETKCGCVLTDAENTILSTGFNGFIRGVHGDVLPNVRP